MRKLNSLIVASLAPSHSLFKKGKNLIHDRWWTFQISFPIILNAMIETNCEGVLARIDFSLENFDTVVHKGMYVLF